MIGNIQRTIIIGGMGEMAQLMLPYLPEPTTIIDIATFGKSSSSKYLPSDRTVRRLASAALSSASKNSLKSDGFGSLCIVSVPNQVYHEASHAPGRSKLCNLLGVSGRGYRSTLFVHQTSTHTLPSEILEPLSGAVFGVHLLHGARVQNFNEQTAVITTSERKRSHDKHNSGHELLTHLLRKMMGYQHVFSMSPARHDTIMSDIQFLTHSMLLILGDALISNGYTITPENYRKLPSSILILLGRMGQQRTHVYKGIAIGNTFNKIVLDNLESLATARGGTTHDCLGDAIRQFDRIRDSVARSIKLTPNEQNKISTPMSRARDGIIAYAHSSLTEKEGIVLPLKEHVEKYINSIDSTGYDKYFERIMGIVGRKLEVLDFENLTIKRYEDFR